MPHAARRFVWTLCLPAILLAFHLLSSSGSAQETSKHIILPNPTLIGCTTPACSQLVSEDSADANAIHPWQVMVDFNQGKVIGLVAYYDKPVTFDDVRAAIDERYAKWTAPVSNDKLRIWRVEPEHFVISLSAAASGMVQVVYLAFDARHPNSEQAEDYLWCSIQQAARHCTQSRASHFFSFLH